MAVGDTIGGAGFNQGPTQILSAEVGQAPAYQEPYLVQALGGLPTWYQAMGMTGFRGANTIIGGGWADRRARRRFFRGNAWDPEVGTIRGSIRNNNLLYPRTWTRYASQGLFFKDAYSPMGMAAWGINQAGRLGAFNWIDPSLSAVAKGGTPLVRGGMFSIWSAAERVGKPGVRLPQAGDGSGSWFAKFLTRGQQGLSEIELQNPTLRRTAALATMQGPLGQRVGGYLAGLRDTGAGWRLDRAAGQTVADQLAGDVTPFQRGARAASGVLTDAGLTAAQIEGKVGMRAGAGAIRNQFVKAGGGKAGAMAASKVGAALGLRTAGMAVPGLNVLLGIWTAYDIAKAIVPRAPEFAADVYTSYTGWGNRRMFGAPFKTNEAAITSRQRGVTAIQNSRMNARSVIGAEASGMHAYFG